jgi:CheY-like chemotaxis protein
VNILVVGGDCQILPLLQQLNDDRRHGITHCTTGAQAIAELERGGNAFDWIVLEGRATVREGVTVARAIRAMGCAVPILSAVVPESQPELSPLALVCAVEKVAHSPVIRACRLAGADYDSDKAEILFEFHSPCRKRKRKSARG